MLLTEGFRNRMHGLQILTCKYQHVIHFSIHIIIKSCNSCTSFFPLLHFMFILIFLYFDSYSFHVHKMINDAINMLKSSLQLPQNFPEKGLPARAPLWPLERTVKSPKTAGRLFSPLKRASLRSSVQSKNPNFWFFFQASFSSLQNHFPHL